MTPTSTDQHPTAARPFAQHTLREFVDAAASARPAPGGGAVIAACAANAAALGRMVVSFSENKKSLAQHAGMHAEVGAALDRAASMLLRLADEDAAAFAALQLAERLPTDSAERDEQRGIAAVAAVQAPLSIMALAAEILTLLERLAAGANRWLGADLAAAAVLAEACIRAARHMVSINLPILAELSLDAGWDAQASAIQDNAADRLARVLDAASAR